MIIIGQDQANLIDEVDGISIQNSITNLKLPVMMVPAEMMETNENRE